MHTHSRYNFSLAFFTPLSNFCVNLVAKFWFDFAGIPGEESEKSLSPAVDDIDFMQRYCMDNFFSFLYLAFGAPDKFGLVLSLEIPQMIMPKSAHLHPWHRNLANVQKIGPILRLFQKLCQSKQYHQQGPFLWKGSLSFSLQGRRSFPCLLFLLLVFLSW